MNNPPNRIRRIAFMISGTTDALVGAVLLLIGFGWLPIDIARYGLQNWYVNLLATCGVVFTLGAVRFAYNFSCLDEWYVCQAAKTMKTLLKPTLIKVILAFILFTLFSYLWRMYVVSTISDTFPWGFPLQFYLAWGPCPPGELCRASNLLFGLLDVVFWYLVSAFLVLIFSRKLEYRRKWETLFNPFGQSGSCVDLKKRMLPLARPKCKNQRSDFLSRIKIRMHWK